MKCIVAYYLGIASVAFGNTWIQGVYEIDGENHLSLGRLRMNEFSLTGAFGLSSSESDSNRDSTSPDVGIWAFREAIADYNNNGLVEQADLDLVLLNWGETGPVDGWVLWQPGDNPVDQDDLDRVLLDWGKSRFPIDSRSSP